MQPDVFIHAFPEPEGVPVETQGVHLAFMFSLSAFSGSVSSQVHLLVMFFFARGLNQPFAELHKETRHKATLCCSALILMLSSPYSLIGL